VGALRPGGPGTGHPQGVPLHDRRPWETEPFARRGTARIGHYTRSHRGQRCPGAFLPRLLLRGERYLGQRLLVGRALEGHPIAYIELLVRYLRRSAHQFPLSG
jgi:hypothetical protein